MLNKLALALILLLPFTGCAQNQSDNADSVTTTNGLVAGKLLKEIDIKVKTTELEDFPTGVMAFIELGEADGLLKRCLIKMRW